MLRGRSLLGSVKSLLYRRSCTRNHLLIHNMSISVADDSLDDAMFPRLVSQVLAPVSKLPERSIYAISQLLVRDQCTVPFLVRYRQREMIFTDPPTQEVTAPVIFKLQQELEKWTSLVKLRKSRLAVLKKSEQQIDAGVVSRLERCLTRAELDEAYEGVKPTAKTTKVEAAKAVEGLEEVASLFLNERRSTDSNSSSRVDTTGISELLRKHKLCRDDPVFCTHLQNYLADLVAHSISSVASSKQLLLHRVRVTATEATSSGAKKSSNSATSSSKTDGKNKLKDSSGKNKNIQNNQKYRDYFHFDRSLRSVPSHQVLALRRGKEVGPLKVSLAVEEKALAALQNQLQYQYQWRNSLMANVVLDAVSRLMAPVITRLAWKQALETADEEAVGLFASNLRHLLLTPPLSQYLDRDSDSDTVTAPHAPVSSSHSSSTLIVCGVDPGFAHGHKVVVLAFPLLVASAKPEVLCCTKLYTSSRGCSDKMAELLARHRVQVVAIGNGTGSREAQDMTKHALESLLVSTASSSSSSSSSSLLSSTSSSLALACRVAVVSEVGASVYSVSPLADAEYPEMDVAYRGAVSIAGRLVDPLREMVKVPPSALGLGMYQHDQKEAVLSRRLGEVLQEIVSECGVDLNMASEEMLCYVSGLQRSRAKAIVAHREQLGGFRLSRAEVRAVKGIGETTFRNCIGFLRVYPPPGAATRGVVSVYDPLDATNVHPEKYKPARAILRAAWHRYQQKQPEQGEAGRRLDDTGIRQLLFSSELQEFFDAMSEDEWANLAADCSKELESCKSVEAQVLAVSEVKQLGMWLSAEEFCGESYSAASALSSESCAGAASVGSVSGHGRGIRANRGQPPLLTRVTSAAAPQAGGAESGSSSASRGKSGSQKKKRGFDIIDGGADDVEEDSTIRATKRMKSGSSAGSGGGGGGGGGGHQLEVGDERVGTVRNVTAFGVFLDIGASRDALLHTSEFSYNKKRTGSKGKGGQSARHPLVLGATVRVAVKSIDTARDRISLTQID